MQPQDTPQTYAAKVKAQLDWIDQTALSEVLAIGQQARFSNRAILPSQAQKTADFAKALSMQAQNRLPAVHKLVYQYIRHLG